jgi:rhodanese-related sulfurtransferase
VLSLGQAGARAGQAEFVTWIGIGPDKWASAWLIQRHVSPGARIRFIEPGTTPTRGTAFDIPEVPPFIRDSRRTTFESLLAGYQVEDAVLAEIATAVHDIEVNFWGGGRSPVAPFLEQAFRGLQFHYGRENVPQTCYFELFDALYAYLQANPEPVAGEALEQELAHDPRCGSVNRVTVEDDRKYVAEWHPDEILHFIGAGDRVVFVDTRERGEFEEGHIPGAVNIKLRDLGGQLPAELRGAEVVVPYCVKDFRGFEVAKRLKRLGAQTVGLMNPYGISGWKARGLPVVGSRGLNKQEGAQRLRSCVEQPAVCIQDG